MKIKTSERGWYGHYICGDRCTFTRNTLVKKGDKRYVVSTVGAMKTIDRKEYEAISLDNRYYETMIFRAKKDVDGYWDANVRKQIYNNSNWQINNIEACSDRCANDMHEENVKELCHKLIDNLL